MFNPGLFRTGDFLVRQFPQQLTPAMRVLDMGTGSGIGAVFAAQISREVLAVDINPEAVRCARINVLLNCVDDRVQVVQSDLFAAVPGQRFDVVLFNPPFFHGQARDLEDHAWRSENTVERFAAALRDHLTPTGFALVILSTNGATTAFLAAFRQSNLHVEVVAQQDVISEILTVYKLTMNS